MDILSNHLKNNCDPKLPGVLSLSVREAYRFLDDMIEKEKVLQRPEMKKAWGHLRNGLIDVGIKQVLQSSNIHHEIADKTSSRYINGYTYLMVETRGAILTPSKVRSKGAVPRKAIFRNKGSLLNKQYDLFNEPEDLNERYDESTPPFLLLTYGGRNHKLDFVKLGLPNLDVLGWIDQIDITNVPVLLTNTKDIKNDLQLTFTSEAEKIIRRGEENASEDGV